MVELLKVQRVRCRRARLFRFFLHNGDEGFHFSNFSILAFMVVRERAVEGVDESSGAGGGGSAVTLVSIAFMSCIGSALESIASRRFCMASICAFCCRMIREFCSIVFISLSMIVS